MVEDRTVALAIQSAKPHFSRNKDRGVILHSLATASRCRGLFLGILMQPDQDVADALLAIFSLVMQAAAQALESFELYGLIRTTNRSLETQVDLLQAEVEERVKAERLTAESQQMLRLVLSTIPQYVFWKGRDNAYQGCNQNFARLAGLDTAEAIVGRTDRDLPWPPEQAEVFRETDARLMDENRAEYLAVESLRLPGDKEIWIEANRAPLLDVDGRVIGLLCTFQDITERRASQQKLAHMALHDALTELPNRTLFLERLQRAMERRARRPDYNFAVLLLDLDRFKLINDSQGHLAGDRLLIESGRRIASCLRSMDTVARLGGDEFAILLEEFKTVTEALRVSRRILREVERPLVIKGYEAFPAASGGLLLRTDEYRSTDDILRDADIAMYRAKAHGGKRFKVFRPSMRDDALRRAGLEADLRQGLSRGELFCLFQPIHELPGCGISGFEALVRWRHPEKGVMPPDDFIPVAEDSGLIVDLDLWVLTEACQALIRWQSAGLAGPRTTMAVNLSARHFAQPGLAEKVRRALSDTGLDPACLTLEITEHAVMAEPERALVILRQLKGVGVGLAIDDFGTGYSSLAYLQSFPIDVLKIDRSFIKDLSRESGSFEIVRAVVGLGQGLSLKVVAEGVEESSHLDILGDLQCQFAQGYLFSHPIEEERVLALLKDCRPAS
jgi:Amt family ammonium transporter